MTTVLGFVVFVLVGSLVRLLSKPSVVSVSVVIDTTHVIHKTDPKFLSVAIDSGTVKRKWHGFDFSSKRLHALASGLSPAYIRLGGTEADYLIFDPDSQSVTYDRTEEKNILANIDWYRKDNNQSRYVNYTMTGADWEKINIFSRKVKWHMLFDVNVLLRDGRNWDPRNAKKLLDYSSNRSYQIDWQLGNEPLHYKSKGIGGNQIGKDYVTFRRLLNSYPQYKSSPLVGPELNHPSRGSLKFLNSYLKKAYKSISAVTFHQYYLNGRTATIEQFMDPHYMDNLKRDIQEVRNVSDTFKPRRKIWISETSSAYGGGAPGLSDSYVAGFLWIDKLGLAAREKVDLVVRQTFFHGNYALIDDKLEPLPDYWLSLLYKKLVGQKVLKVLEVITTDVGKRRARIYAHCTRIGPVYVDPGGVTVLIANLYNRTLEVSVSDTELKKTLIHQYLLTPPKNESLTSKKVLLNDVELKMDEGEKLPEMKPKVIATGENIRLPPLTFGFYVWPHANLIACKD